MSNKEIFVTQSYLPDKDKYINYINKIWDSKILTNQGPLLNELEKKLKEYLNLNNIHFLTNGTLPLQIAIRSLGIEDGEIITTPFSYVATTSSILWERCKPVFVDIEQNNFSIDANKIEKFITKNTKAIMAVHCFGFPCDLDALQNIASKHNIKLIYDGAHAFGCFLNGKSLLSYGDITTCSFHATKLFHTIEGGLIFSKNNEIHEEINFMKKFGHEYDIYKTIGINAKASEFQAAMGLCNIEDIDKIIFNRKKTYNLYIGLLDECVKIPKFNNNLIYNYGYFPVLFKSEHELKKIFHKLNQEKIFPRRYFYPSLNRLPYLKNYYDCPISEDISGRIACLPIYYNIETDVVLKISKIIKENI